MIFKNKKNAKLALMLFFATSTVASAQYNVDYSMGEYSDPQTIESSVDIGGGEIITVGTLTVSDIIGSHKDVVLTRLGRDGSVIWNMRYGANVTDEVGNGITLSWDKDHVIVVGSITKAHDATDPVVIERQALVIKIRISDGAVLWTTYHGISTWDDQAFVVKRSNGRELGNYIVVGESKGDREQPNTRMYSFKIDDSGNELWSKRYYLTDDSPVSAIHPTSMVEDGYNQFIIAGIREEGDRPSQIFTVGIRSDNGDVVKDLNHYPIRSIYNVATVDIDRHPEGKGYGISFTALDFTGPCLVVADFDPTLDRIGVIRLDDARNVDWAKVYYEKDATNHNGLSIRFYKDELQVCININRAERYNTPGLLRVDETTGNVIFCNTYEVPFAITDYGKIGNNMIRSSSNRYFIKSLFGKGFSMVNADASGLSVCDLETRLNTCGFSTSPVDEKCEGRDYGRYDFYRMPKYAVRYSISACRGGLEGLAPEINDGSATASSLPINKVLVYPSPLTEGQDIVNVKFITDIEEGQGNVKIMNGMGQVVVNTDVVFITGENKFVFDTKQFSTGLYVVMITVNGELMDQVKFVKN